MMKRVEGFPPVVLHGIKYAWTLSDNSNIYRLETPNVIVEVFQYVAGEWRYTIYGIKPNSWVIVSGQWNQLIKTIDMAERELKELTEETILWEHRR